MKRFVGIAPLIVAGVVAVFFVSSWSAGQGPRNSEGRAEAPSDAAVSVADVATVVNEKFSKYDKSLPLWAIQPGTATRMRQMTESFNLMWFAAQADNWEFAGFEIYRAGEEYKAVAVTRPGRAALLKAFMEPNLKALADAAKAKDKAAFEVAYDNAIAGCNGCHSSSEGGGFKIKAVKITRPATPIFSNIDFRGN